VIGVPPGPGGRTITTIATAARGDGFLDRQNAAHAVPSRMMARKLGDRAEAKVWRKSFMPPGRRRLLAIGAAENTMPRAVAGMASTS
jgi:hypothetical protein